MEGGPQALLSGLTAGVKAKWNNKMTHYITPPCPLPLRQMPHASGHQDVTHFHRDTLASACHHIPAHRFVLARDQPLAAHTKVRNKSEHGVTGCDSARQMSQKIIG